MHTGFNAAFVLAVLLVVQPVGVAAQDAPAEKSAGAAAPVAIALVLVNDGSAPTVFRRANVEPRNVIVVDRATDARQLSAAVLSLLIMEAEDPTGSLRADHAGTRSSVAGDRIYPWAAGVLSRLDRAVSEEVPGFGRHRTMQILVQPLGRRAQ